jgi:hypothetical protein
MCVDEQGDSTMEELGALVADMSLEAGPQLHASDATFVAPDVRRAHDFSGLQDSLEIRWASLRVADKLVDAVSEGLSAADGVPLALTLPGMFFDADSEAVLSTLCSAMSRSMSAHLLLGQKGSGKSSLLRHLAIARAVVLPGSLNLYLNLRETRPPSLKQHVWTQLLAHLAPTTSPATGSTSLPAAVPTHLSMQAILGHVFKVTGHPLFLAVDEVQDLFLKDSSALFADVLVLGSIKDGTVTTVICGSAAVTRALCFAKLPLSGEYPGYHHASLNHTKYTDVTLPPLSFSVVDCMVRRKLGSDGTGGGGVGVGGAGAGGTVGPDDDELRACVLHAYLHCGGNGRVALDHAVAYREGCRDSPSHSWDWTKMKTHHDLLLSVRAAIVAMEEGHAVGDTDAWALVVARLAGGGEPVWVAVRAVHDGLTPVARERYGATLEAFTRRVYDLVDDGVLRQRDGTGGLLEVSLASALQGVYLVHSEAPAAATRLCTYHQLCLRYPYSALGIDAEDVVAASLVERGYNGATSVQLWPKQTRPLSLPSPPGDLASTDPAKRDAAVKAVVKPTKQHVSKKGAFSTVVAGTPLAPVPLGDMLAHLSASAGTVFKEYPDDYGGDLVWWTVTPEAPATAPVVTVHRVQVKLGVSTLAVGPVSVSLKEGWDKIQGYFNCGPGVPVVHDPIIVTTRAWTGAAPGVTLLDGLTMISNNLWSDAVQAFARAARLEAYVTL